MTFGRAAPRIFPATVLGLTLVSCSGPPSGSTVLTADMPLHLEDHLDDATIVGSEVPVEALAPVEWHFDEPQPDWKPLVPLDTSIKPIDMTSTEGTLRLTLTEADRGVIALVYAVLAARPRVSNIPLTLEDALYGITPYAVDDLLIQRLTRPVVERHLDLHRNIK